jgi:hypothetical protein
MLNYHKEISNCFERLNEIYEELKYFKMLHLYFSFTFILIFILILKQKNQIKKLNKLNKLNKLKFVIEFEF